MPNWVDNRLTITGNLENLAEVKEQMSRPYENEYYSWQDNKVVTETKTGEFLLWNAIRPLDLDTYYQRDKVAKQIDERNNPTKDAGEGLTPEKLMEKVQQMNEDIQNDPEGFMNALNEIQEEFKTGMDWYNWNVRNWGTKWEINESWSNHTETSLGYSFETAWSPPVEALINLSKMYPALQFHMEGIDENGCFAYEVLIQDGNLEDRDVEIDHNIRMKYWDYCHLCSDEGLLDPDYEEDRIESGCYEARLAVLEADFE